MHGLNVRREQGTRVTTTSRRDRRPASVALTIEEESVNRGLSGPEPEPYTEDGGEA
jgi:hypothetical protein